MRFGLPHDGKWHIWFAWHPVKCEATGETVWLENVERKFYPVLNGRYVHVKYRLPTTPGG
ncbi:MAG: hypothetical protein Tp118SUR00d2C21406231_27 [Prokaryotic dsDNA virus sp.]|nr:MAG: hypothetical protein Tp125DCM00d2C40298531_46 [Prokaryotic dsDNA virus sp.]QDP53147.1 MAG: hypothetical protein Tp118SUR00d2C21406231_27 [Prokaryotic dsDNA virus sp.]